ncbi:MAG: Lrp/AsnC family transcriptional regulator [Lentisphaeria bacterium]|nr:Lrp/AsnC family transcriptional regulator [Lentisphaeria bacterium]
MQQHILNLLSENARISVEEMALRLNTSAEKVTEIISELEAKNIICGYTAILNETNSNKVTALIEVKITPQRDGGFDTVARRIAKFDEVKELYLVSGAYDLLLEVEGESLQQVAMFVSGKLSTIEGVLSCTTGFQLKKYKQSGKIIESEESYERLKVCP